MNVVEYIHKKVATKEMKTELKNLTEDEMLEFVVSDNITNEVIDILKTTLYWIMDRANDMGKEYINPNNKNEDERIEKLNMYANFYFESEYILKNLLSCSIDDKLGIIDCYRREWLLYVKFILLDT